MNTYRMPMFGFHPLRRHRWVRQDNHLTRRWAWRCTRNGCRSIRL